jgi:hypothetical protein
MPDELLLDICSLLRTVEDLQEDETLSPTKRGFLTRTHATFTERREQLINQMASVAMDAYPGTDLYPSLEAFRKSLRDEVARTRSSMRIHFP